MPKEVPDILKSDKGVSSASHFTFGSDEIGPSQYESLTKAHIVSHPLPPIENYGASQRKTRNTIEMIDGEKPDLRSTQKAGSLQTPDNHISSQLK
jgi:hypothetical protein